MSMNTAADGPDEAPPITETLTQVAKKTKKRTVEALQTGASELREAAQEYGDRAKDRALATKRSVMETIRGRPGLSTGAAFGAGLIAGMLLAVCTARSLNGMAGSAGNARRL